MLTSAGRELGEFHGSFWARAEEGARAKVGFDGGTGEVAVVANSCEAFWQDVEEAAAQELGHAEGHDAGTLAAGD